jgi:hypothetical protein
MSIARETDWDLRIGVDDVLRGQGADPALTRARRPLLVERAQAALTAAEPLLRPVVLSDELLVVGRDAESLQLENGVFACGAFVAARLADAERLVVAVCTIGEALETAVARTFMEDPVTALALDGVGSAAIEKLAAQACRRFQARARRYGLRGVVHCRPGATEWPTEMAQPQLFGLLDPDFDIGDEVRLLPSLVMRPLKSLTLLLGLTREPAPIEHECDVCAVRGSCRYRAANQA